MENIPVPLALGGSAVLVLISALIFVNAIEYIGFLGKLGGSFVSAILSPLFTSLPEMIVFLVAVFAYAGKAGEDIGLGTIFGQPFMASSLSYGLVGIAVLIGFLAKQRKTLTLTIDKTLMIPYVFVLVLFPLALVPALIQSPVIKHLCGIIFVGGFIFYVWLMHRRRKAELIEEADLPYFHRLLPESRHSGIIVAIVQLAVAAVILYFGSNTLVSSVDKLATNIGVSTMGLAVVIIPAATAIPETASAIIWSFKGKDTFSIGSLVGEKILYCTFYPGLALFVTNWVLDIHAYLSVIATTIISLILLYFIARQKMPWWGLCIGMVFFVAYAFIVFGLRL
ncbi:MAG: sodium:calcium antiporter [Chloroflexi bacterium]|nr:sodium:calcium antiporter [Chloroflexota bacterium]